MNTSTYPDQARGAALTDTIMSDLLPCPFCGGEAGKIVDETRILGTFNLIHRCPVIGPLKIEHATQEAVITTWNTRAPSQAQIDREHVAFSMWKAEADRAAPNVGKSRTPEGFAVAAKQERYRWLMLADTAIEAIRKGDQP